MAVENLQQHALNAASTGALLEALVLDAPVAMAVIGGTRREFLVVNPAYAKLAGRPSTALLGKTPREAFPEYDEFARRIDEMFATGAEQPTVEIRGRNPRDDGEYPVMLGAYRPIKDQHGRVAAVSLIATDVTEAVRGRDVAEALARQQQEALATLQQIVDDLPEGVVFADSQGTIVLYNAAARDLFGQPSGPGILGPTSVARVLSAGGEALTGPANPLVAAAVLGTEHRNVRLQAENSQTGARTPVLVNSKPIRDGDGSVIGAMATLQDIADLTALERQKDEFLAILGHELRSPVALVQAAARTLRLHGLDIDGTSRDELLGDLEQAAGRAVDLLDNLLALGRAEVGHGLEPEPVLVAQLVRSVCGDIANQAGRTVGVRTTGPDLVAHAAPIVVERVMLNLLSNAVKYSPPGKPIEVQIDAVAGEVLVRVLDEGIGIDETDVARLLQPYQRSSRSAAYAPGIGVGLTVCVRLLESQQGRLWARARPFGGAEFGFALPRLPRRRIRSAAAAGSAND